MPSVVTGHPTKIRSSPPACSHRLCQCESLADIFASPEHLKTSAAPDFQTNIRLHDYRLLIKLNSDWVETSTGFLMDFWYLEHHCCHAEEDRPKKKKKKINETLNFALNQR